MKKFLALLLALVMVSALCVTGLSASAEEAAHIGIVTGSVSQSEDDRRGAEAFQAKYGEDVVKLAIYHHSGQIRQFTEPCYFTPQSVA